MAEKNLEVKNLRISFRTNNGKVQAVRDISFDLERGRTLAIVGESGSGKSVTSRAIMGILAGNAIIEGGEILYDGKDLLKIEEDEMYKIRGDKIAMIFQDPLSSLNPIMKIGKQITEAMLLKNKASRKAARKEFNDLLQLLQAQMVAAGCDPNRVKEMTSTFDKFCVEANRMENTFNRCASNAEDLEQRLKDTLFRASKNQRIDASVLKEYVALYKTINGPFFTANYTERLETVGQALQVVKNYKPHKNETGLPADVTAALQQAADLLSEMTEQAKPNFFRIGYYAMRHPNENLLNKDLQKLSEEALVELDRDFMKEFIDLQGKAVQHSRNLAQAKKNEALKMLTEAKNYFSGDYNKRDALKYANSLANKVEAAIDRLEIIKDGASYTFRTSMVSGINRYFAAMSNNPKEEIRYARQTAKREKLLARGKKVDWKVIPKSVHDLAELRAEIISVIERLEKRFQDDLATVIDTEKRCVEIIDFLKDRASKAVYKVTRAMAKEKAIKLMEEVGIPEPRMRFYQYPFEFSGGMRQRIVIAIALSADPEILICDEPTTALDVTIQAQILELINNLKKERNLSVIFITHDLGVVANMADDIAVMYAGKIAEYGTADDVFYDPRHPYTWALLSSMPDLDTKDKLDAIPGTPPDMIYPPVGDAFADRNKYALQIDFERQPPMFEISETHKAATWLLHPEAPQVEMPRIVSDRIERMKAKQGGA